MMSISETAGTLNNLVGICRYYGVSEKIFKNIKSHKFDKNRTCSICSFTLDILREHVMNIVSDTYFLQKTAMEILNLNCNEIVIKNILE